MNKSVLRFQMRVKKGNTWVSLLPEKQQIELKMVKW